MLALQGDFAVHADRLNDLGIRVREVREPAELIGLDGLILPGGESTTLTKLLDEKLRSGILRLARQHPVWGTCAGMIMLAKSVRDARVQPFELIDLDVDRNGYGRQVHSFEALLRAAPEITEADKPFPGVFIRAPRATRIGSAVKPLLWLSDEPVAFQQDHVLACSFHPELSPDDRLHRFFLSLIPQSEKLSKAEAEPSRTARQINSTSIRRT